MSINSNYVITSVWVNERDAQFDLLHTRSVARKETLGVHQKNWVCHIYCQINAQKKNKHAYWVLIC